MSVEVSWGKDGNPAMAFGSNYAMTTKDLPGSKEYKKTAKVKPEIEELTVDKHKVSPWFEKNSYPEELKAHLKKSPELRSGIDYKIRLGVAKGLMPVKIKGYKNGNEQIEIINNPELNRFLRGRMIRRYQYTAYQNLYEYGNAFPQLIYNDDKTKISVIKTIDSPYCRFTQKNKTSGVIENCIVSGKWPDDVQGKKDYTAVNVIDLDGTPDMIEYRAKELKNFIYPININTAGNEYYQLPPWDTAKQSGHVDISTKIATYINKMFDNQMSIKYHIKIPYSYWDWKYPPEEYATNAKKKERKKKIQKDLDEIEENLTKAENAKKAIISHFKLNPQGRAEEKWEIDVIDDLYKSDQYLPQAAASNAEILTSLGVHPAIKGLSLSAGPYTNSEGGSNIREAFLIDNALAWLDRQEVLDPIELMVRQNFNLDPDVEIWTKEMVLTTLDEGSGSKTVS